MSTSTSRSLRQELPPLPTRMQNLPVDERGYPVPWFVAWMHEDKSRAVPGEGKPEFRLMDGRKLVEAVKWNRCWVCGGELGKYKAFTIGPMCVVNRINAEPPSHLDCADFSARACPFLTRPHMRRRENDMPENLPDPAGIAIMRNPGIACVFVTDGPLVVQGDGKGGILFNLGEPHDMRFYAHGEPATEAQVCESIESGLPLLERVCQNDEEREALASLVENRVSHALQFV